MNPQSDTLFWFMATRVIRDIPQVIVREKTQNINSVWKKQTGNANILPYAWTDKKTDIHVGPVFIIDYSISHLWEPGRDFNPFSSPNSPDSDKYAKEKSEKKTLERRYLSVC